MVNKIEKKTESLLSIHVHVAEFHKQGLIHHIHGTSASKKINSYHLIFFFFKMSALNISSCNCVILTTNKEGQINCVISSWYQIHVERQKEMVTV